MLTRQALRGPLARLLILSFALLACGAISVAIGSVFAVRFTDATLSQAAAHATMETLAVRIRSESLALTELVQRSTFRAADQAALRQAIANQQETLDALMRQALNATTPHDIDEGMALGRARQYLIAFSTQASKTLAAFDAEGALGPRTQRELLILVENYQEPLVGALGDFERLEAARAIAAHAQARQVIKTTINGLALIAALVAIVMGFATRQIIVRVVTPLTKLRAGVEQIRQGTLNRPIPISRQDELGRLTEALNTMWAELRDHRERLEGLVVQRTAALSASNAQLAQEISERQQIEAVIRRERMLSESIINSLPGVFYLIDERGHFVRWNQNLEAVTGYTADELAHLQPLDFFAGDEQQTVAGQIQEVFATGAAHVDADLVSKRGARTPHHFTGSRVMLGGAPYLIGVGIDIAERKRAEAALRETRDYLDNLITYASAPIIVWDPNFVITRFNHAFEELAGIAAAAAIGQPLAMLFPDEQRGDIMTLIHRTLSGEQWQTVEIPIFNRPTGATKTVLWNSANVLERDGQTVLATIAQGIDITERRQAEQRAFELALERERVGILTRFIQDASHEFRTPLAIMQTNVYLLERIEDPAKRQRKLTQIGDQVTGLTRLVDLLAEMARLDSSVAFTTQLTDLNGLVDAEAGKLQTQIAAKGLTLQLALAPNLPPVAADGVRLGRALHELLDNAVRFTPAGGAITVRSTADAAGVTVEVADTGPGIPPNVLPRIFERFYRQDAAHTTPGFGLGLPIARAIIERHGGRIEVASQGGAGSVFRIELPIGDL